MTAKLSVIIPCRDAVHDIRACVESARLVADEVLIADSGSVDGTLELAASLPNCRVIQGFWNGYARFKNWAIPQAAYEWVLILDADERVTPELADEIRAALEQAADDIDGYWVRFRCFFLGYELRYSGYNSAALRLIRRDRCRYELRSVHEEILAPPHRTRRLQQRILHYSIWSYDQYFAKWSRYTRFGAEELHAQGKRATLASLTIRPLLRFAQLYFLRGGFLDGYPGLQVCALTAFFNTFVKQARLWERDHARPRPLDPEIEHLGYDALPLAVNVEKPATNGLEEQESSPPTTVEAPQIRARRYAA